MLLSIGVLSVGMMFIAGVFPVAIYFSTVSTERTVAAVVADEAFAKIRIYAVGDLNSTADDIDIGELELDELKDFNDTDIFPATTGNITADDFAYPSESTDTAKQYYWSALCRQVDSTPTNRLVQVTVFVSRKAGNRSTYPGGAQRPVPVKLGVSIVPGTGNESKLMINVAGEETFINGGCTIADNQTGRLYRVLQRDADAPNIIVLDRIWQGGLSDSVWVVPPPVGGGRYPCIAIYQKVIRF